MIALQSVGTIVLAAVVAAPSALPRASETTIAATRIAAAPVAMYPSLAGVCRDLHGHRLPGAPGAIPAGTAIRVLHIAEARCGDATVPMLEVRVDDRQSRLDGMRGYLLRAAAPLPLADG
jgi:hypothetical protein